MGSSVSGFPQPVVYQTMLTENGEVRWCVPASVRYRACASSENLEGDANIILVEVILLFCFYSRIRKGDRCCKSN